LLVKLAIHENAVNPALDGFQSDNFLFQFGWLFGPVYLLPWLFLYGAFLFMRWQIGGRRA
jgi:hypothetical protein